MPSNLGDLSIPANIQDAERASAAHRAAAALIRHTAGQLALVGTPDLAARARDLADDADYEANAIDEALATARFTPRTTQE